MKNNLAFNVKLFSVGTIFSKSLAFLLLPYLTYIYTVEEYGQLDLILTTANIMYPIISFAIIESIVRYGLEDEENSKVTTITNSLFFTLLISLVLIIVIMLSNLFSSPSIVSLLTLVIASQIVREVMKQIVRICNKVYIYVISDFIYIISFVGILFLVNSNIEISVSNYFYAMIVALLADSIFLFIIGKVYNYISKDHLSLKVITKLLRYSLPLVPNTILWWVIVNSDKYMLFTFLSYSSVGVYAVAGKFLLIVNQISNIFYRAWQMTVFDKFKKKEYKYINYIYNLYSTFLIMLISLIIIFSEPLLSIMIDESFYEAKNYLPLLLLSSYFSAMSSFLGTFYQATFNSRGIMYTTLLAAVVNILLNLVLIPIFGIYGAIIATIISFAISNNMRVKYIRSLFDLKLNNTNKLNFIILGIFVFSVFQDYMIQIFLSTTGAIVMILVNYKSIKVFIAKLISNR